MTFQTTDIIIILALVCVFTAVSIVTGIIAYKTKIKKIRSEKQNDKNNQE